MAPLHEVLRYFVYRSRIMELHTKKSIPLVIRETMTLPRIIEHPSYILNLCRLTKVVGGGWQIRRIDSQQAPCVWSQSQETMHVHGATVVATVLLCSTFFCGTTRGYIFFSNLRQYFFLYFRSYSKYGPSLDVFTYLGKDSFA